MSVDDDVEFRDLISQTLEMNGCLAKLRAQLRASIFLTLDEDEEIQQKEPLSNKKVKSYLETFKGRIMFCLVREFLEFFNLDFTKSVFDAESYLDRCYSYGGRSQIIENLGILNNDSEPLLLQLINSLKYLNQESKSYSDLNLIKNDTSGEFNDSNNFQNSSDSTLDVSSPAPNITNTTYKVILPDVNNSCSSNSSRNSYSFENVTPERQENSPRTKIKNGRSPEDRKGSSSPLDKSNCSNSDNKVAPNTQSLPLEDKLDSSKVEKSKTKGGTSHLSDLPPLQVNKAKCSESQLLPSLYKKEKTNLKEIDKLLSLDESTDHSLSDDSNIDLSKSLQSNSSKGSCDKNVANGIKESTNSSVKSSKAEVVTDEESTSLQELPCCEGSN